ncbi:MAG: cation:proton antiporter [Clostridia bacterium]|nr:cation:proton antiporter [Clostridia bacterium]
MFQLAYFPIYFLVMTLIACMYRAVVGPTNADRLIAVNVIGTKTIVLISMISVLLGKKYYEDVVVVYALISYLATVIISRYVEERREADDDL